MQLLHAEEESIKAIYLQLQRLLYFTHSPNSSKTEN